MGYRTYTCAHASMCGGCELLSVPYELQLKRKHAHIAELFKGFDVAVEEPLGMDEPRAYRAKVMAPFVRGKGGKIIHGMYERGTHRVVPCESCLVEYPEAQPIIATIAKLAQRFRIEPYDEDTGRGLLRHAVIRVARKSRECMVTLVINRREFPRKREFVRALREEHPEISTVVFNVNTRRTNAVLGPEGSTAYGQGWLEDELCGLAFRIPSSAFYQTNPEQTEKLYRTAVEMAGLAGGETVLDAYCGIGTIGLIAADSVRRLPPPKAKKKAKVLPPRREPVRLIGVESVASAVEVAEENARINRIAHAGFFCSDAGEFLGDLADPLDVVFMDPPRSGASERFVAGLLAAMPRRIVYISCNPATQLRDVEMLQDAYELERLAVVDMFPHTKHVETVALLERRRKT